MSILLADTTLALNVTSQISTEGYAFNDLEWIELTNSSPWACHVSTGGNTLLLPAWYTLPVPFHDDRGRVLPGLALPFTVTPYLQTIPGSGSVNTLHTVLYPRGETPKNTVPTPLGGGPIDLTIANQIISTTNAPANTVVFAKPTGDTNTTGATSLTNSGILSLGDPLTGGAATYNGTISVYHQATAPVSVTAINGLDINIAGPSFEAIDLSVASADPVISIQNSAGTSAVTLATSSPAIDLSTLVSTAQAIKLLTGGMTRIHLAGPFTTTNVATNFAHGLGAKPDIAIPFVGVNTATAVSVTSAIASMDATNVSLQSNVTLTSSVYILSIKF